MPHLDTRREASRPSGRGPRRLIDDAPTTGDLSGDELMDDGLTDDGVMDDDLPDDDLTGDDLVADGLVDHDRLDGAAMARWRRRRRDDLELEWQADRGRRRRHREPPWPLRRATPPAGPFPVDALGPALAAAARAIQARTLAPLALCGQAVLGAAALATQAHADVLLPDGRRCPLSLALLSVASPGERLGAVAAYALRQLRAQERHQHATYALDLAAFRTGRAAWRAARRGGRERGRAAPPAQFDAAGPEPAPPRTPGLVTSDPTPDGLLRQLAEGQPGMGLFNAEDSPIVGGPGLSKAARRRMAGALARLWDDGSAERRRARDGVVKLYGKRLSVHLAATPGEGPAALAASEGSALFSRMLCVMPASTIGTRFLTDEGDARIAATQPDLDRFDARIVALLRTAPRVVELAPRALPLAPDAARQWRAFANAVEAAPDAGGDLDDVAARAAMAAGQVVRIAGVLSLFADVEAAEIPAEAVAGAIALVRHYLDEAGRIAGLARETAAQRRAQAVLDYITGLGRSRVHLAEIYQLGPYAVRDAPTARAVMRDLEDHGYVEGLCDGAVVDGLRRREAWRVLAPHPADLAKAAKVTAPSASAAEAAAESGQCDPGSAGVPPAHERARGRRFRDARSPSSGTCPKAAKVSVPSASAAAEPPAEAAETAHAEPPAAVRGARAAGVAKAAKVSAPRASAAEEPPAEAAELAHAAAPPAAVRGADPASVAKPAKVTAPSASVAARPAMGLAPHVAAAPASSLAALKHRLMSSAATAALSAAWRAAASATPAPPPAAQDAAIGRGASR